MAEDVKQAAEDQQLGRVALGQRERLFAHRRLLGGGEVDPQPRERIGVEQLSRRGRTGRVGEAVVATLEV